MAKKACYVFPLLNSKGSGQYLWQGGSDIPKIARTQNMPPPQ